MLNVYKLKFYSINKKNSNQGFVVLIVTLILSLAGILFTVNMASSQVFDNYIIGNYYRNNEAFASAESGINFVLSQLSDPLTSDLLLFSLPTVYEDTNKHYRVTVTEMSVGRLAVSSEGRSVDETALRKINLEVDFNLIFPIPKAAVSVNGKLNLDESALVNDGCEGLAKPDCISSGNIAENMVVSNPAIEVAQEVGCTGEFIGKNIIASSVLKGSSRVNLPAKVIQEEGRAYYDWGKGAIPSGIEFNGVTTSPMTQAKSLFEATFSIVMNHNNLETLWDNAAQIDVSSGENCAERLQMIDAEKRVVYIKGDCHINQYYAQQSNTSENKVFTIGSTAHPKLVFIEGGTFKTSPNTGANVVGMLYFLPSTQGAAEQSEHNVLPNNSSSIDMGAVNVNGALLSDYKCSHDGYDKSDKKSTKQHFSVRFDKQVLDKLYSDLGVPPSDSHYRVKAGSWRDF